MTAQPAWVAVYRVGFALLALCAVAFQLSRGLDDDPAFRVSNFFSYFTIESNIFAAVVFLALGLGRPGALPARTAELIRGAAVLYLVTTGIVYELLLSGGSNPLGTTSPWDDNVVHRIFPLVLLADWLIRPPSVRLTFRDGLIWLLFPVAFLVYSMIRGPIVDWYPYGFLDPGRGGGYAGVAGTATGISAGIIFMTWLVTWAGRWPWFTTTSDRP